MALFDQVNYSVSTESIKQQSTVFFKELTSIFKDFNGESRKRIHDGEFTKRMKACVKHHLGLEPEIEIGNPSHARDDFGPAAMVIPPTVSRYYMSKKEAAEFTEEVVKVNFNLSTGKITGSVKRVLAYLYFDTELIVKDKLSPEEHAAVTLHEIGHLFFILYYSARLATTNMALDMIARDFDKSNTQKERVHLYQQYLGPTFGRVGKEIEEISDLQTLSSYVYQSMQKTIVDELGSPQYGYTMDEYLADMYATRHGAGVPLITALQKLTAGYDKYVSLSRGHTYLRIIHAAVIVGFAALNGLLGGVVVGMLIVLAMLYNEFSPGEMEYRYDNAIDRIKRVRNQIQLRMRLLAKDSALAATYKKDLETMDEIIAAATNKSSSFSHWLSLMISPKARSRKNQAELEMFFEDLAYNKLHEEALTLKFV